VPHLKSGTYSPKNEHKVTHWPAPDKDGDQSVIWQENKDDQGRNVGRSTRKDEQGNEVKGYAPPEGFENRPGFDHTDNWVRVDDKGNILRDRDGNSLRIKPGAALVEYANGTSELLEDEYSQYEWAQRHNLVEEAISGTSSSETKSSSTTPKGGSNK
jgi:hypothetical protein